MRIAILTNFREFNPGYSLTGIVQDQCRMLTRYGHEVAVFVNETYKGKHPIPGYGVRLKKLIPEGDLTDYRRGCDITPVHEALSEQMAEVILKHIPAFDFVITHDLIFTGWNLPYANGLKKAAPELRERGVNTKWGHWIHSVPTATFDWWSLRRYGPGHKIVFPVRSEKMLVAEQFQAKQSDVKVIPHIKDMRSWMQFDKETCRFIDDYPEVMQADFVQIYPASTDRLSAKRVRDVIMIFAKLKKKGFSVCLVCANQWATGTQPRENIDRYVKMARRNKLTLGEFVFTSEWDKRYEFGIPQRMVRELFQLSNLFIFPTREESFGLIGPEASLAGGVLLVLNKSLESMLEVHGFTGLYFDFGSFMMELDIRNEDQYYSAIADIIIARMRDNESIMSKVFHRQHYNWDKIYNKHYGPMLSESQMWG